jgi:hypothetical protein
MRKNVVILLIVLMGVICLIEGCNDDSNSDTPQVSIQLSGVAAAGAPLMDAAVTAVNIYGQTAGPAKANADGTYSLTVVEGAPYLLKAYSKKSNTTLFSYAPKAGTANITPLTNLALFVAAGLDTNLESLYKTWKKASIPESEVMTSIRTVNANLADIYTSNHVDADTYNFLNTPFTANGKGIDGVLDALEITLDPEGASIDQAVNIFVKNGTDIIFDPNVNISSYFLIDRITPDVAYAKVSTGDALLVCSYDDETCKAILAKNALLKSELEQKMASLPKNQEIIFY